MHHHCMAELGYQNQVGTCPRLVYMLKLEYLTRVDRFPHRECTPDPWGNPRRQGYTRDLAGTFQRQGYTRDQWGNPRHQVSNLPERSARRCRSPNSALMTWPNPTSRSSRCCKAHSWKHHG